MRKLNEKDIEILSKLAPEIKMPTHYRSILPPVSIHLAGDEDDFRNRLERLSADDFEYLADRILGESECLLCVSPESARIFLDMLEKNAPEETAKQIRELYTSSTGYEL
jgi:hypothetical protein